MLPLGAVPAEGEAGLGSALPAAEAAVGVCGALLMVVLRCGRVVDCMLVREERVGGSAGLEGTGGSSAAVVKVGTSPRLEMRWRARVTAERVRLGALWCAREGGVSAMRCSKHHPCKRTRASPSEGQRNVTQGLAGGETYGGVLLALIFADFLLPANGRRPRSS